MTNGEWIRNLDDKQLANFLESVMALGSYDGNLPDYDRYEWRKDDIKPEGYGEDNLSWLQKEVLA